MPSPLARLVRRIVRSGRTHEDAAVLRQRRILRQTRRDVLAALAVLDPASYRARHLATVLAAIADALRPRQAESVRDAGEAVAGATAIGTTHATAALSSLPPGIPVAAPATLVQALVEVVETQLTDVWRELGAALETAVRRVALGAQTPDDAIAAVLRLIRQTKTFGAAETRAEVIVRTEVNRAYSVATDARFRELDRLFDGQLRKAWIHTADDRTRASHREAGRRYGPDGTPIPIDQPFIVGRAALRYPLDPLGPAKETIGCRCRLIAIPPEVA